jgi:hypothetical protein
LYLFDVHLETLEQEEITDRGVVGGVRLLRSHSIGALEDVFGQLMALGDEADAKHAIELDDVEFESVLVVVSNRHDDALGLDDGVLECWSAGLLEQ